jgi:hypothetical protein
MNYRLVFGVPSSWAYVLIRVLTYFLLVQNFPKEQYGTLRTSQVSISTIKRVGHVPAHRNDTSNLLTWPRCAGNFTDVRSQKSKVNPPTVRTVEALDSFHGIYDVAQLSDHLF